MKKNALIVLFGLSVFIGCNHDPIVSLEPDPCAPQLSYAVDIFPLIDETCNYDGCHAGAYDTYEGIEPKLFSGKLVDRVFQRNGDPALRMPPSSTVYPDVKKESLTQAELDLLQCWIKQGYPR